MSVSTGEYDLVQATDILHEFVERNSIVDTFDELQNHLYDGDNVPAAVATVIQERGTVGRSRHAGQAGVEIVTNLKSGHRPNRLASKVIEYTNGSSWVVMRAKISRLNEERGLNTLCMETDPSQSVHNTLLVGRAPYYLEYGPLAYIANVPKILKQSTSIRAEEITVVHAHRRAANKLIGLLLETE